MTSVEILPLTELFYTPSLPDTIFFNVDIQGKLNTLAIGSLPGRDVYRDIIN